MVLETKRCKDCGITKPLSEFARCGKKGRGVRAFCRPCYNTRQQAERAARKALQPPKEAPTERACKQCGEVKPLTEFPFRRKHGINYRWHICHDCYLAKRRADRAAKSNWIPPQKPYIDSITGTEMRHCIRCEADKPLIEFQLVNGKHLGHCKSCSSVERKAYYIANREEECRKAREYAIQHPEQTSAQKKQWWTVNRERMLVRCRRYNEQRRESSRAYNKKRRSVPGFWSEQYRKNPSAHIDRAQRHKARKLAAPVIERIHRKAIIERDRSTCYLCGTLLTDEQITLDHVIPLARGGNHTNDNLRVACMSCNGRKSDRLLEELDWYSGN